MALELKNFKYLSSHSSAKLMIRFKSDIKWFGRMLDRLTEM